MRTAALSRGLIVTVATVTALCFGATGQAAAMGSITNTGPGSHNKIYDSTNNKCVVNNTNDVSSENTTVQTAVTGDASVHHNTGSSGWGAYDPGAWKAKGYSYAQWKNAVMAYVASQEGNWHSSSWGGGGSATSGDASNHSSNNTSVNISNNAGDACGDGGSCGTSCGHGGSGGGHGGGGHGGSIDHTGPDSHNKVLGSSTSKTHLNNENNVMSDNYTDQYAETGEADSYYNTYGGHGGSGSSYNKSGNGLGAGISNYPSTSTGGGSGGGHTGGHGSNCGCSGGHGGGSGGGGHSGTISNTGPNSYNKVSSTSNNSYTVNNSNNVSVNNTTSQYASSGDATVSYNTSGGSASTGAANNYSSNQTNVSIRN